MEGAHIPKGKTLVEIVGQNKLVNFSIPSSTKANKQYSVWVMRPREAVQVPRKVHVSCLSAVHALITSMRSEERIK